jgi:hypothetical protein
MLLFLFFIAFGSEASLQGLLLHRLKRSPARLSLYPGTGSLKKLFGLSACRPIIIIDNYSVILRIS